MATQVGPSVPPNNKKDPKPGNVRDDKGNKFDKAPLRGQKNPSYNGNKNGLSTVSTGRKSGRGR